jgi:hypothetical protein
VVAVRDRHSAHPPTQKTQSTPYSAPHASDTGVIAYEDDGGAGDIFSEGAPPAAILQRTNVCDNVRES